jgi:hypothetical protein
MTRNDFLQKVARAGWLAYDLNATWIRVTRREKYTYPTDGPINSMGVIDILLTPEAQINLMLPAPLGNMCPGRPGQLRHFRVIAADWADAWALVEALYQDFEEFLSLNHPFEDVVILTIPAVRLIPDDFTFYFQHRGMPPLECTPVEPTPEAS